MDSIIKLISNECGILSLTLFVMLVASNLWHAYKDKQNIQDRRRIDDRIHTSLSTINESMASLTTLLHVIADRVRR